MGIFETANRLSVQFACINPLWSQQTNYVGAPKTVGDGVSMGGSPSYLICIDLRENVAYRTIRVTVETLDDTADYSIELDGTSITYSASGGDTEADILQGMLTLIEADVTLSALVAGVVADVGSVATLTLTGRAEADFAITDLSATATGELACIADPTSLSYRIWASLVTGDAAAEVSSKAARWRLVNGANGDLDYRGLVDQPLSGGVRNIYAELFDIVGFGDAAGSGGTITYSPTVLIGPGQAE